MAQPTSPCRLCGATKELQESHILPGFVFRWMKATSATGYLRFGQQPNLRVQDGLKLLLLCGDCEGRFNHWETQFANKIFHLTFGPDDTGWQMASPLANRGSQVRNRLTAGGRDSNPRSPVAGRGQAARNQIFRTATGAEAYVRRNKAADRLVRRAPDPPSRNLPPPPFLFRHRRARRGAWHGADDLRWPRS
jgi:hypothetical protein